GPGVAVADPVAQVHVPGAGRARRRTVRVADRADPVAQGERPLAPEARWRADRVADLCPGGRAGAEERRLEKQYESEGEHEDQGRANSANGHRHTSREGASINMGRYRFYTPDPRKRQASNRSL